MATETARAAMSPLLCAAMLSESKLNLRKLHTMTTSTTTETDVPVTINPTLMCHDCNTFMDESRTDIWACPRCGVRATVQYHAEVIDDGV